MGVKIFSRRAEGEYNVFSVETGAQVVTIQEPNPEKFRAIITNYPETPGEGVLFKL